MFFFPFYKHHDVVSFNGFKLLQKNETNHENEGVKMRKENKIMSVNSPTVAFEFQPFAQPIFLSELVTEEGVHNPKGFRFSAAFKI